MDSKITSRKFGMPGHRKFCESTSQHFPHALSYLHLPDSGLFQRGASTAYLAATTFPFWIVRPAATGWSFGNTSGLPMLTHANPLAAT